MLLSPFDTGKMRLLNYRVVIERFYKCIRRTESYEAIKKWRAEQNTAFTVFGALTGQRTLATVMKLAIGQLRELCGPQTVLRAEPHQDKIRMERSVP